MLVRSDLFHGRPFGYITAVICVFFLFCDLPREAVKPPPQPTHTVAVHIPSQQDMESDSDIEEVRHVHSSANYHQIFS